MTLLGNKYFDSLVIIITVYFGFSVFNWQDFSRSVSKVHNDLSKYIIYIVYRHEIKKSKQSYNLRERYGQCHTSK